MVLTQPTKIYLASTWVDLRKSYQTLSMYVQHSLQSDPLSGQWFVFYNRRRDLIKILYWQTNGFCLWQKRLEKGSFILPADLTQEKVEITAYQLHGLVQGLLWQKQVKKSGKYHLVS